MGSVMNGLRRIHPFRWSGLHAAATVCAPADVDVAGPPRPGAGTATAGRARLSRPARRNPMSDTTADRAALKPTTVRTYDRAAAKESVEDYSLRYSPVAFRRWSPFVIANVALGGIAYLADFAIG